MQTRSTSDLYGDATRAAVVLPEGTPSLPSRVSWGAVIAGAVVALTIGLMLNSLGAGVGATTVDATARGTPSASSFGIGAGIWFLVSNL
ncbi:PhnA-like protein, partial [Roseomonas sp. KE2513]|nr:PhnA-like protein [Roseomonas sp. KE2513]